MSIPTMYDIKKPQGGEFELLPDDVYVVKITNITLIKDDPGYNGKPPEDKFDFEFTITEQGRYVGQKIWHKMRPILSGGFSKGQPSWLYKLYTAVNQVSLNDEATKLVGAAHINDMLGKSVRVTVKQKLSSSGKTYSNVTDYLPLKGATLVAGLPPMVSPIEEPLFDTTAIPPMDEETSSVDINVDDIPF